MTGFVRKDHYDGAHAGEAIPRSQGACFALLGMNARLSRNRFRIVFLLLSFVLLTGLPAKAQELKIETREGSSVATNLEFGDALNNTSSLKRKWITVNDPSSPVRLSDTGMLTAHRNETFFFEPIGWVNPVDPVSAVNVRFALYDMFGNHLKTLSGTIVEDFGPETSFDLSRLGFWATGEPEARELLTIVTFVAHVRTQGERVWNYSPDAVVSRLNGLRLKTHRDMLKPAE